MALVEMFHVSLADIAAWVVNNAPGYTLAYGQWAEAAMDDSKMYCVVQASNGPAAQTDVRRPRFRVVLLGRRGQRGDSQKVMTDAEMIVSAALGPLLPCNAARIGAQEPSGPGFTTENRAWVSIDLDLIV